MLNITTSHLTSPVRKIEGNVELYKSSTSFVNGETVFISDANISHDIKCKVSSKNKIYYPYYNVSGTIKGVTYTVNADNSITAKGTATEDSFFYMVQTYRIPKGTYTLSSSNLTSNNELRAAIYNLDNTLDKYIYNGTFTITEDKLIYIYLVIIKGNTVDTTFYPQLELGTISTPYAQYIENLNILGVTVNGLIYYPDDNGNVVIPTSPDMMIITVDYGGYMELEYINTVIEKEYKYNDALKSIQIERVGEKKFFGFGVCQKANLHLIDKNRTINISTANFFKVDFDMVFKSPNFYVSEVHRDENTNELSITAYDAIYAATEHTTAELVLNNPYTIKDFAIACANLLGLGFITDVPEDDTTFSLSYPEGANFEGTETIREALNAIAEATLTIYYIDKDNNLVFKRLQNNIVADLTISKSDYIEFKSGTNRRLAAITSITELGDNITSSTSATGTTQYVRNNPFWELREDITDIVDNAVATIGGLTINQFECKWRGNYALEIGDKIELVTKDNATVTSFLLDDVISYDGSFSQVSQWSYEDSEKETATPTTLGEAVKYTYAKVDKVNKEIEIVASETEANSNSISALQIDINGINASVNKEIGELAEKVEATVSSEDLKIEVQQQIASGVDKVTTATGFTFNEAGLTVSKTGSEMTTTITEDGMTVKRDDNAVLTADNIGVKAENLHATTYLIIGENSRFEDYDNRTGCFWIGG